MLNLILLQCLVNLQKGFNKALFCLYLGGRVRKTNSKKMLEMIKKELQASIFQVFEEEIANLNVEVKKHEGSKRRNITNQKYENLRC